MDDSTLTGRADPDATVPPDSQEGLATLPPPRAAPPGNEALQRFPPPAELAARFEMLAVLGKGGMGIVYRARDRAVEREVAIKRVLSVGQLHLDLFREEAKALARLEHPNVVRLYEFGAAGGSPYLVMELVRGQSLAARLAAGRPTLIETARLAIDVLRGLGAAHAAGIAHLDLKPANVFLDAAGGARVADFGLARRAGGDGPVVQGGTPGYMAPEQWNGQPVPASDVFAFGAMLHEMLTGRKLLAGAPAEMALASARASTLPAPSRLQPSVPPAFDDLVRRALDRDPAARPTAAELERSLSAWLEQLPGRGARPLAGELPPHPYKVLEHFGPADAAIFFGREDETAELVHLIEQEAVRLVTVSGPCGIGKSSLLAAGVRRALDPARHEVLAVVAGTDPARAVLAALCARAAAAGVAGKDGRALAPGDLALEPGLVVDLASRLAHALRKGLVLLVDQCEELFTQNPPGAPEIAAFFELVERLVEAQGLPFEVVLAHRVEFRGELAPLEHRLARHAAHFPLGEISRAGLIAAIEGPSRHEAYGFAFEAGLPARLADDILATTRARAQSALPVAQIVCRQLRERAMEAGGVITAALYTEALGGAAGALQRYVEARLASPEYARAGALARRMLAALTVREDGRERFARALDEDELLDFPDRELARATLERLLADHLVVREATDAGRRVRLASEVICPLVDRWTLEPDDAERAARTLARAARQWEEHGRRADDLLQGATLALVAAQLPALAGARPAEHALVAASLAARRRQRLSLAVRLVAVTAAVGGLAWFAFLQPGRLKLDTSPPGAEVWRGAERIGSTPLEWSARPGAYALTVRREGHRDVALDVRISAGGETARQAALVPLLRTLEISTEPSGATCEVRRTPGEPPVARGTTPFAAPLPDGVYEVSLARAAYLPRTERIELAPDAAPLRRTFALERNSGQLQVANPHPGARLTLIDAAGKPVLEVALPMPRPLDVEAGRYRALCTGEGLVSDRFSVAIARETTSTYLALTPPVRVLSEGMRPERAEEAERVHEKRADLDGKPGDEVILADRSEVIARTAAGRELWKASTFTEGMGEPQLSDLDADGLPDVVIGTSPMARFSPPGGLNAFCGLTGDPLFSWPLAIGMGHVEIGGDRDGDGSPDVVIDGYDDKTRVLSAPVRPTLWLAPVSSWAERAQLADVDRDGVPDVVIDASEGARYALSGRDGSRLTTAPPATSPPAEPVEGGEVDLDGDGRPETIAIAEGTATARDRAGKTLWTAREVGGPGLQLTVAGAADLDGDGARDPVIAAFDMPNAANEGIVVALSARTGKRLWRFIAPGKLLGEAVLRDLTADGVPDVLIRSGDQGGGPDEVLALDGKTGRRIARWAAGHSTITPLLIERDGVLGLVLDRADPEGREYSAVELVRVRQPLR